MSKVLVLAAALVVAAAAGATIEQGFALDGATTYCQGVKGGGAAGALGLGELPADSAGKCPVAVTINVPATTVKQRNVVAVTWSAKANAGVPNNRFPSSVDAVTKIPKSATSSWLKACKVGTNCGTVVDAVGTGPANAESGPFDAKGSKNLRASQFTFNEIGEFIIVGKVVLPGDESLKISATEYVVLKKITVVDVNTVIPPTATSTPAPPTLSPSPSPSAATPAPARSGGVNGNAAATSKTDASNEESVVLPKATESGLATVKPGGSGKSSGATPPASGGGGGGDSGSSSSLDASTSTSSGFFASNSVLLGCVLAGCFVACIVGFAFVMRRRSETKMRADKGQAPDARDSVGMLESGDLAAATYVQNTSARYKGPAPPVMMSASPPVVFDASVRGSELSISSNELKQRDVSEVSSLASEAYSDTLSNFDDASRPTQDQYLESFDWTGSEDSRQSNFSIASKPRGVSTASALSDLSEGPRDTRLASEISVDSYAFAPSPRESTADSYMGGYSESSRISGMSMYSDVSSDRGA
ncbi:hypothetical protein PybrP1_001422 [[Pythium] brassicae (nom. inval.)]|nr:hypothetical protein PybrP1_001422 [[Pythium] brassicae (nom. inval.)]